MPENQIIKTFDAEFEDRIGYLDKFPPEWMYAGIDEVGVSSIAGPMVAAVVILPKNHGLEELPIDSKKLKPDTIQKLAVKIKNVSLFHFIAYSDHEKVNEFGIENIRRNLWKKCARELRKRVGNIKIIIDGRHEIDKISNQEAIIKADGIYDNVSAAAIISKAWCDNQLKEMDMVYPIYNFAQHKGYPTKKHLLAIQQHGQCEFHRFHMVKKALEDGMKSEELELPLEELQAMLLKVAPLLKDNPHLSDEWSLNFLRDMWKMVVIYKKIPGKRRQYFLNRACNNVFVNHEKSSMNPVELEMRNQQMNDKKGGA